MPNQNDDDQPSLWARAGTGARVGFVAGVLCIAAATLGLAYWALRTDYDVLFNGLSPQDAAAMTRELDQMKQPYRLDDGGASILVDRAQVHATRLKLMGKDLPLQGAVGFELFNNADFGMTEFAQKINYQRALQGEITRTILSLHQVASARVHLALPEEGVFKRDRNKAKASITLSLRQGQALRREQVAGITRLVAAAVPGVAAEDVTIVDQHGVALTAGESADGVPASSQRLELKREIEQHLAQKANAVLEKAFGAGQAMASVDVTLDMNLVRVTTEDVLTPPPPHGELPSGVVVRERETIKDAAAGGSDSSREGSSTQRETEYQLGRRVQQVVSSPGAVTRIQALAVLKASLSSPQLEQAKALLANAVGVSRERGDSVVVQALDNLVAADRGASAARADTPPVEADVAAEQRVAPQGAGSAEPLRSWLAPAAVLAALLAAVTLLWSLHRRTAPRRTELRPALSIEQRQASLASIQAWLQDQPTELRR